MKKRVFLIIIIISILAIIISFSVLVFSISKISKNTESSLPKNEVVQNALPTSYSEICISPNATLTKICTYKKCGHTVTASESVPNSLVNITEDDFKKLYSEWNLVKFTPSLVEVSRKLAGNCDEHFLVKDTNGYIAIYHIKNDNDFELLETTGIATKYLSQIDLNELENGVTLYGKEKLNAYIEDFE